MTSDNPPPLQRIVTCPGCGGPSVYSLDNAFRPFCGERCKNHDLGAWASEEFAIPAKPGVEDIFEAPERLQ